MTASCDPKILKLNDEIVDKWFKKDGIIMLNVGEKDAGKYFRQVYEAVTDQSYDSGDAPTYQKMKHFRNRVNRIEKDFNKKTGKIAKLFYLSEEVLKRNYHANKTFDEFKREHDFFQGRRDTYQQTMNTIIHMLGEHAKAEGYMKKAGFKNVNKAHKALQKRYNRYQELMMEGDWGAVEDYYNTHLRDLGKEEQFKIFEIADELFRFPDLIKSTKEGDRARYAPFNDIVVQWRKIAEPLFKDLNNGMHAYIGALKEANKLTGDKYAGVLKGLQKIQSEMKAQPNYFPIEALNIIPTMKVVQESIYDRAKSKDVDYDKLSNYIDNIADIVTEQLRLSKHTHSAESGGKNIRRSIDVIGTMDNYIRNVTMFNFAGNTTKSLLKGIRNLKNFEGKEGEEQAKFYSTYLFDTHASLLGLDINSSFGKSLVRGVTSWEFMSKLGLNLRSAARNATQSLQNLVYFGVGGTYDAFKYLQGGLGEVAVKEAQKYGVYFASARELTNTLGLFPEVVKVNKNGKEHLTYRYDTVSQKFTQGLEELARKSGTPMRIVENKVNRQATFKIAFALHHRYLNNNRGMMEDQVKRAIDRKETELKKDETIQDAVERVLVAKSSKFASNAVRELHYEYSPFAKPEIMRGPAGSILFQFMTYGVNFYKYQHKIAREAKDSVMAGDWNSKESWRLYRLGTLYAFLNGVLSPLTNTDVGNLVQHDTYERAKNFVDALSGDKKAYFGKGPLIGTAGGPFVADMVTLGNVFGFYDLLSNGEMSERNPWGYLAGYEDYASKRSNEKLFDVVRTLNTQIGRSLFMTAPRMWNGASIGTLIGLESGLHKDKVQMDKKMDYIYPLVKPLGVKKPKYAKTKPKKTKKQINPVIQSLESLSKSAGKFA